MAIPTFRRIVESSGARRYQRWYQEIVVGGNETSEWVLSPHLHFAQPDDGRGFLTAFPKARWVAKLSVWAIMIELTNWHVREWPRTSCDSNCPTRYEYLIVSDKPSHNQFPMIVRQCAPYFLSLALNMRGSIEMKNSNCDVDETFLPRDRNSPGMKRFWNPKVRNKN